MSFILNLARFYIGIVCISGFWMVVSIKYLKLQFSKHSFLPLSMQTKKVSRQIYEWKIRSSWTTWFLFLHILVWYIFFHCNTIRNQNEVYYLLKQASYKRTFLNQAFFWKKKKYHQMDYDRILISKICKQNEFSCLWIEFCC